MNDMTKFCRSGKDRHPRWHTIAVTSPERPTEQPRFSSDMGWRNYKAAMADHDPVDADHYAKMFVRFARDTINYRHGRKAEAVRHKGGAHCHKAQWLMARKDFGADECLLFPSMTTGMPTAVKYNYREMAAARAMLLMTKGRPDNPKAFAIHRCGNGHLSCVNPNHLKWGSAKDNAQDAKLHRPVSEFIGGLSREIVDEIRASSQMVKIIAERLNLPSGVVSAIKAGEQFVENLPVTA